MSLLEIPSTVLCESWDISTIKTLPVRYFSDGDFILEECYEAPAAVFRALFVERYCHKDPVWHPLFQ